MIRAFGIAFRRGAGCQKLLRVTAHAADQADPAASAAEGSMATALRRSMKAVADVTRQP
jgi:hypothetical protein